ncbi:hypothetical protein HYW53_02805 [Candidatus Giovannonibacteria bacterium]|nr:hypothetical protein [Candidatus Giovannonibacteria bacterium]
MNTQIKEEVKQRKNEIFRDQEKLYSRFSELVEQVIHARIIADAMWKFRHDRGIKTGFGNSVISFSHVALENFVVLQLFKLFDRKYSVFNVWDVAQNLTHPNLLIWLEEKFVTIKKDFDLISEWRHVIVGHRGETGYFVSEEFEKKFTEARISEKRLRDFLLEFLCQIKFEMQRIKTRKTMEGFNFRIDSFGSYIKKEMAETFKYFETRE